MNIRRDYAPLQALGRWPRRCLLILLLAAGLGACATNPATGGVDFVMMSEEDEIELGRDLHP